MAKDSPRIPELSFPASRSALLPISAKQAALTNFPSEHCVDTVEQGGAQ